jgi:hypothetical protein
MKNEMLRQNDQIPDGVFNPFSSTVLDESESRHKSPPSQRSKED